MSAPVFTSSPGGAGLHVQPDRGDRSSDDAQGLRYSWMGGQHSSHHIPRIHEVPQRCYSTCSHQSSAVKPQLTTVKLKLTHKHKVQDYKTFPHVQKLKNQSVIYLICFVSFGKSFKNLLIKIKLSDINCFIVNKRWWLFFLCWRPLIFLKSFGS